MAVSPSRAAAFHILLRTERDRAYASELLHSESNANLSTADHRLATELVMGVLRWRSLLDDEISAASSQKLQRLDLEVLTALRLGVYQLRFLSRIPARAAIFESVEIAKAQRKRSAAPFVNAVLRKVATADVSDITKEIQSATDPPTLAARSAHPGWLIERWTQRHSLETARAICLHNQSIPSTSIYTQDDETSAELSRSGVQLSPGMLLATARRVDSGDLTNTAAYREGRVAIQDEASQLIALLVGNGNRISDCCAAPGSKTALLAKQNPEAQIFASDLHPHRARLLRGLTKSANVHVLAADARDLPYGVLFDRILADVPCSGTGTLARNPEIKWRLVPSDLLDLQARQIAIVKSTLPLLSPNGRLLYSTCSLEREENEDVLSAVLEKAVGFKLVDCRLELQRLQSSGELLCKDIDSLLSGPYLRTLPGLHPCDGFFAAIIERIGTVQPYRTSKLTTLPVAVFCPAAGVCVTIMLAAPGGDGGIGEIGFMPGTSTTGAAAMALTLPTFIPASCKARVTLPNGCPTKLGMTSVVGSGPRFTSKLIFGASTPLALAGGLCDTT
jgi:16S rRNA (cytosine967-C5)-methyltransferase